jgi:hypothetical protein
MELRKKLFSVILIFVFISVSASAYSLENGIGFKIQPIFKVVKSSDQSINSFKRGEKTIERIILAEESLDAGKAMEKKDKKKKREKKSTVKKKKVAKKVKKKTKTKDED